MKTLGQAWHSGFIKNLARHHRRAALKLLTLFNAVRGLSSAARLVASRRQLYSSNIIRRDRRVVFVSERPGQREAKLAFGLRQSGWDVIQLYHHQPTFADRSNFTDFQRYSSPWHGLELAHRAKARLFHAFSAVCDDMCIRLVDRKPGRVIVDFYDHFYAIARGRPVLEARFAVDIARQRYCIERADAVCCRDLKLQYDRRITGIGRGKRIVYFPEYCWNSTPLPERRAEKAIHIVQIGSMGFETRGVNDVGCFKMFEQFVKAGCHVHVYLHPYYPPIGSKDCETLFADYLSLAAATGRMHLHATVPSDKLIEELTGYDFGFGMFNAMALNIPYQTINPGHLRYAGSSRMFDYLDAGLGLLLGPQLKLMFHQFRFTGLAVDGASLLHSGRIIEGLQRAPRHRVLIARERLSILHHIYRLSTFYERLV